MKRIGTIAALAGLALATLLAPGGAASTPDGSRDRTVASPDRPRPDRPGDEDRQPVNFVSRCRYSHSLPDDPIVSPGGAGRSHMHDFFANTSTSASSTPESLLEHGETTCNREGDTAAYWVPALYANGDKIDPLIVSAYYTPRGKPQMRPFPQGLKIIAGDATTTEPQGRVTAYSCGAHSDVPRSHEPPACPEGERLRAHVRFPDCWDGSSLDSEDHKSHMTYSRRGRCPSTHPVPVPGLNLNVVYDVWGQLENPSIASGSVYSMHADFVNAWDQAELARLVNECLNAKVHCGPRG